MSISQHYEHALALFEKNDLPALFAYLHKNGVKDHFFNLLRQEFIHDGASFKHSQQLKTYLQIAFENVSIAYKHLLPEPFQSECFLGRQDELQRIHACFFDTKQNTLLLMSGQGGIGKTTLASHYYHTYQAQYKYMAWVLVQTTMQDALLRLAVPLGIDFGDELDSAKNFQTLIKALKDLPTPCLLVLDNANDKDDTLAHYQTLRNCQNLHILLTSRLPALMQETPLEVLPLPDTEAVDLFKRHYPRLRADEMPLLHTLLARIGKNTLLIELIAKNLAYFNKFKTQYSLENIIHDIEQSLLRLSKSTVITATYHAHEKGYKQAPVEDFILAMYDLAQLTEEENRLLSVFAILPAERIGYTRLETLYSYEDLHATLALLVDKGWIEQTEQAGETMLKPYPAVQDVTRTKNQARFWEDNYNTIKILEHKLDYQGYQGHLVNVTYEEAMQYVPIAERCVQIAQQDNTLHSYYEGVLLNNISILCENVGTLYQNTGNLPQALQYYKQQLQFNILLTQKYPADANCQANVGVTYSRLGNFYESVGKFTEALTYYQKDNEQSQSLCNQYPDNIRYQNNLATSHQNLGNVYIDLGQNKEALLQYQKRINIQETLCKQEPTNIDFQYRLSIAYEKLGDINRIMQNFEESLVWYQKEYQICKILCQARPNEAIFQDGLAIASQFIGIVYIKMQQYEKALFYFEQYQQIAQTLYTQYLHNTHYQHCLASSYYHLGKLAEAQGNTIEVKRP
ncbi:MAG: hypothetical protein EAZ95_12590 [Bacteroidetes bacterium]|nr:MAG: hypothetical protein EAZ95_12590 [Bacteroidota bacterium]